jgi:uncharacterized membrane-anchored protein
MNVFDGRAVLRAGCALLFAVCFTAAAQEAAKDPEAEVKAALEAIVKVQVIGPKDIPMADQANFKLPSGMIFVPAAEAGRLLRAMGNRTDSSLLGMVLAPGTNWFAVMTFIKSGYVKDDDAREWKADDLLDSIKAGTEESNKERKARGIPEMEVVGWIEPPTYDAGAHRLVWSLESKLRGAPDTEERGVNYNTYALGRDGYISVNFVTGKQTIQMEKGIAHVLLSSLEYNTGKKYTDFNVSTDHMAEFGLAALVGGIAAKKLGLLALIAAFAVKFAKVIGVAALALGAGAFKFFRRDKGAPPAPPTA